jgi:TolC family type I secretion outer membrane protein
MSFWRGLLLFLLAFAFIFSPFASKAEEEPLSLSTALKSAYLGNPTLNAARAELRAVHERLPQAMANFKPSVSAEGRVTNTNSNDDIEKLDQTSKDISLDITQPLYRGGRTSAEMESARDFIRAQNAVLKKAEQDILLSATTAFMDVVRDRALLDLSQNNQSVIAEQLKATRQRFEVGDLTLTDVSQSESRLARGEADVIAALADLRESEAVFEEIIGFKPAEKLDARMINLSFPNTLEDAIDLSDQDNPDIIAAVMRQKSAESDVDNIFGELLPNVGLFAEWKKSYDPVAGLTDEQTDKSIGLSVNVPLYESGAVRSRVRAAKETANQQYMQIIEAKRNARQLTISSWEALNAAQSEIKSREAQVKASEVAREGVTLEAELGARTILDSLDSDQELLDARASLVTARRNEVVAQFTLAGILGMLSPETLGFPEEAIISAPHLKDVTGRVFNMDVDSVASE